MRKQILAAAVFAALSMGAVTATAAELTPQQRDAVVACLEREDEAARMPCVDRLGVELPEDVARLLQLASDSGMQAQEQAWRDGVDQALRIQAAAVAARGDARSLLQAAMIALPAEQDPAAPSQAQAWFKAALAANQDEPLLAWIEATGCGALASACDRDAGLRRLLRLDPDNGAVHWLALQAAYRAGDVAAARTHLRLAAQASRFDPYAGDGLALIDDARRELSLPPMPPDLATATALAYGTDAPVDAEGMASAMVLGGWMASMMPPLGAMTRLCQPAVEQTVEDAALREDCTAVYAHLARNDTLLIYPMLGLRQLVQLTVDTPEGAQWRERLRELLWVYRRSMASGLTMPGNGLTPGEYATWLTAEGEAAALRHVLERHGIATRPPADWLPDNPRDRALVTTGRLPASS